MKGVAATVSWEELNDCGKKQAGASSLKYVSVALSRASEARVSRDPTEPTLCHLLCTLLGSLYVVIHFVHIVNYFSCFNLKKVTDIG